MPLSPNDPRYYDPGFTDGGSYIEPDEYPVCNYCGEEIITEKPVEDYDIDPRTGAYFSVSLHPDCHADWEPRNLQVAQKEAAQ